MGDAEFDELAHAGLLLYPQNSMKNVQSAIGDRFDMFDMDIMVS